MKVQRLIVLNMSKAISAYFGGLVNFSLTETTKALAKVSLPYNIQYEGGGKNKKTSLFHNVMLNNMNDVFGDIQLWACFICTVPD